MQNSENKYDGIQVASLIIVALGALSLALWILPDWNPVTVFAHISFEGVRAVMVLGNIRVSKQATAKEWYKPLIVGMGSVVMTSLIGVSICSDYGVSFDSLFSPNNPAPFFHKQMGNLGILFMEITLAFILSGEKGYKKISSELNELELLIHGLAAHYDIDHSKIEKWSEVGDLVLSASRSERENLETFKNDLETFKNELETVRPRLEIFKKSLEKNRVLFQNSKISVNGYAPIFHEECGAINETSSNNQRAVICSGCGKEVLKEFKTQIRKIRNG